MKNAKTFRRDMKGDAPATHVCTTCHKPFTSKFSAHVHENATGHYTRKA